MFRKCHFICGAGITSLLFACVPSLDNVKNSNGSTQNSEPSTEEPASEGPSADEPATEEPAAEEPSTEEPAAEEPSNEPSEEPLPAYTGGYPVNPCNPPVQGNGYGVGSVAYDFSLMDQYGEMLNLADFCGSVILLESAAFW